MFLIDTYLDKSKIHGVGVFSKENIKKGRKIQEERSEFEMEFDKNNLPSMPLAFANFLETHSYQKYLHPDVLILQFDNSKYIFLVDELIYSSIRTLNSCAASTSQSNT